LFISVIYNKTHTHFMNCAKRALSFNTQFG